MGICQPVVRSVGVYPPAHGNVGVCQPAVGMWVYVPPAVEMLVYVNLLLVCPPCCNFFKLCLGNIFVVVSLHESCMLLSGFEVPVY